MEVYDNLPPNYLELVPKPVREAFEASKFEWGFGGKEVSVGVPEWVPPVELR